MIIDEKKFEELFPGSMKAINESIENMMIFGTGAIEVTPDGIKSVNIKDIFERINDQQSEEIE